LSFFFFFPNDSLLVIFCSIRYILDIENQFGGQDDGVNCNHKILDPNKGELTFMFKYYWPPIFLLLRVMAVLFVDSLFLYFPVIGKNHKCLKFDIRLTVKDMVNLNEKKTGSYDTVAFRLVQLAEEHSQGRLFCRHQLSSGARLVIIISIIFFNFS
jgi:hypothetical protein